MRRMVIVPLGRVAITTEFFEQPDVETNLPDHTETGGRVEIRGWNGTSLGDYLWRADCFRLIPGASDRFERAHYHTEFVGDYGDPRIWDADLERDPLGWVMERLADLPGLLRTLDRDAEAASVDRAELGLQLPLIRSAVAESMERPSVPTSA
jgi:hypothetical protein